MFRLAHLSDVHLGPLPKPGPFELFSKRGLGALNWLRKRRRIHSVAMLGALTADLRDQAADHIAVTGDLVNLSLAREFPLALKFLDGLGSTYEVTAVPGNHDAYVKRAWPLASQHWGAFMRGDQDESFPFVRRRGPLALIGLSSSLPTLPLAATGRLHGDQLAQLGDILPKLKAESCFRVVLIHHPPVIGANRFRRLHDAEAIRAVLQQHGAELVLHGHHHVSSLNWLPGPQGRIPVIGVPSASVAEGHHDEPAGFNLYEIEGAWGAFRCTMVARRWRDGGFVEMERVALAA